ncbi:primosomal protein DnaI [Bacillus massilinigeriensis]|uniref:primosomal protein DnaI n=1 Tax=Bacillus massilionigeriensis TaxID=1805475 RepID=UPI00096B3FF3|nr:primosomal protein DnaI [Bacillus massilionigeriensis]
MERIGETIGRLSNQKDFLKRHELLKNQILNDPYVRDFIHKHRDELGPTAIDKGLSKLYEFISQSKECQDCQSLDQCKNMLKGYSPTLVIRNHMIDIQYDKCPKKVMEDERRMHENLIHSLYVPKEILRASFSDLHVDKGRFKAIQAAKEFVDHYHPDQWSKGIYLHGPFGTGKTYILGAIANELALRKISSLIVYVPEFLREIKSSIGEDNINQKIDLIKKAPILMMDDIGAESMTSWTRDEILGTILQFRMMEKLPTFFTSNFNFHDLQEHLTYSQRGEEEVVKAARIMERIKYLSTPILVEGPNRRLQ